MLLLSSVSIHKTPFANSVADLALDELKTVVTYLQQHMIEPLDAALIEDEPIDYRALHRALIHSKNMTVDALVQLHQRLFRVSQPISPVDPQSAGVFPEMESMDTVVAVNADEANVHPAFRTSWHPQTSTFELPTALEPCTSNESNAGRFDVSKVRNVLRRTRPFKAPSVTSQRAINDLGFPVSPSDATITPISQHTTYTQWPTLPIAPAETSTPISPIDHDMTSLRPHRKSTGSKAWWHERSISSSSESSPPSETFSHKHSRSISSDRTSVTSIQSVVPMLPKRSPLRVVNDISTNMLKRVSIFSTHDDNLFRDTGISGDHYTHAGELPYELNNFRGICKGAYFLQTNQDKAALKESRPNHRNSLLLVGNRHTTPELQHRWVCKSPNCHFDMPASTDAISGKATPDPTILSKSPRIMYRHSFLFKSHVPARDAEDDGIERLKWYGCVFCHASADVQAETVNFLGEEALMLHIEAAHVGEGKWPQGKVLQRMGCVVGRPEDTVAAEWDIWLPNHYASSSSPASSARTSVSAGSEAGASIVRRKPVPLSLSVVTGAGGARASRAGSVIAVHA